METRMIDNDIEVFYVTATSFPDGIQDAYDRLRALIPGSEARTFYGLSRPEKGVVTYRAAVEELYAGEAEKTGCKKMTIKSGKYISTTVHDFMQNTPAIGQTFREMLSYPDLDPEGFCVEWYFNATDVMCMIRLNSDKAF